MPQVTIDGIDTEYALRGDGPPLLLFSPGGFDATMEKWWSLGIYAKTQPLDMLAERFTCILFDRRECGRSGGRVEPVTWRQYCDQGKGLLDHLGYRRAHLMGGCMGVSPVTTFAVTYPDMVESMILYWPVGGARYRINAHARFAEHLGFVISHGLEAVVKLVNSGGKSFSGDPRGGPWASSIQSDGEFADRYAAMDMDAYRLMLSEMARNLFDRDTAPGPEPESLMRRRIPALVIPGADAAHATSAARYLAECLPGSHYWDCPVDQQSAQATAAALSQFLDGHR